MDYEQAAASAAQEEFRAHWSELVSLTVEVNRWRSLHIASVIGGTAWAVQAGGSIADLAADRGGTLLALSVLNAYFAVSQAWKSWSIHEIGRYCYEMLGVRLTRLTRSPFGVWDEWRRGAGADTPRVTLARRAFWYAETLILILVSGALLSSGALFGGLSGPGWWVGVLTAGVLDILMFAYVIGTALRSEDLWRGSISARADLERRPWRYRPFGKLEKGVNWNDLSDGAVSGGNDDVSDGP